MSKYYVITRLYHYLIEAETPEEAEELVRGGEGEMFHSDFIDGEIQNAKVQQLEPKPIEDVHIDFVFLRNEKPGQRIK